MKNPLPNFVFVPSVIRMETTEGMTRLVKALWETGAGDFLVWASICNGWISPRKKSKRDRKKNMATTFFIFQSRVVCTAEPLHALVRLFEGRYSLSCFQVPVHLVRLRGCLVGLTSLFGIGDLDPLGSLRLGRGNGSLWPRHNSKSLIPLNLIWYFRESVCSSAELFRCHVTTSS